MLVWLALKINDLRYKYDDDRRISYIDKQSYIWWGSEGNLYYIIPNIGIHIGKTVSLEISWLQLYYCIHWKAVSYEEEEAITNGLRTLRNSKRDES